MTQLLKTQFVKFVMLAAFIFILGIYKLHSRLVKLEEDRERKDSISSLNATIEALIECVNDSTDVFHDTVKRLSSPLNVMGQKIDAMITEHKSRINELETWRSYLLQMNRMVTSDKDIINVCIKRDPGLQQFRVGCFTETFCMTKIPIETETIKQPIHQCLPAFYNLKKIEQESIKNALPEALSNEFVETLHLRNSEDLDLRGIEKMPRLKTLIFENCKNIFLEHLSNISHSVVHIVSINTPCLLRYKAKMETEGIVMDIH